ncbi:fatty acid desaturase [Caenispirillum salinarum]|uniref:fatty acid desaturase n=1 Tax=Caenispirillum salinarum TaxID=859058 RepID=UPI00384C27C3
MRDSSESSLVRELAPYRTSSTARSLFELAITGVPFVTLWVLTWAAVDAGRWESLLLTIPAAAFLVRLFMIQHDCGHGSFFANRRANAWVGRCIGVLTLTPFGAWKRAHALHHAGSGNLDRRGVGDIDTLTVEEYQALRPGRRLLYRLYRHPVVMFGIGPAYLFLLRHRLPPDGQMKNGWQPWASVMATNAAVAAVLTGLMALLGVGPVLIVQVPITLIAGAIGIWLFYVQHQFDGTVWSHGDAWVFHEAALHGSSHYDLPPVLRWLTANIGIHHVHHLCGRIPYYRLPEVLRDYPELAALGRLTLRESLGSARLALWDEKARRLVSFREAFPVPRPPIQKGSGVTGWTVGAESSR